MNGKPKPLGAGGIDNNTQVLEYPIPESNRVDDLLDTIRTIFSKHKEIFAIHIVSGKSIEVEVGSGEEQADISRMPILLADIVRKIELVSVGLSGSSPTEFFGRLLQRVSKEGGYASFVVVGNRKHFQKWFTQGSGELVNDVMGMTIHEAPGNVPPDSAVVCIAPMKMATPLDIVKGYLVRLDSFKVAESQI